MKEMDGITDRGKELGTKEREHKKNSTQVRKKGERTKDKFPESKLF